MTQEDFVSREIAELLKEKGFHEPVRFEYHHRFTSPNFHRHLKDFNGQEYEGLKTEWYSAPTLQMATKWLREKYNIYISIQPDFPSNKDYKMCWGWSVGILHGNCISTKGHQCYIETYEEATEAAIKYCLENLI